MRTGIMVKMTYVDFNRQPISRTVPVRFQSHNEPDLQDVLSCYT